MLCANGHVAAGRKPDRACSRQRSSSVAQTGLNWHRLPSPARWLMNSVLGWAALGTRAQQACAQPLPRAGLLGVRWVSQGLTQPALGASAPLSLSSVVPWQPEGPASHSSWLLTEGTCCGPEVGPNPA